MSDEQPKRKVYFGVSKTDRFVLPETNSEDYIDVRRLNEGQRARYEDRVAKKVEMTNNGDEKQTVQMQLQSGTDRHVLFELSVIRYKITLQNGVNEAGEPILEVKEGNGGKDFIQLVDTMDSELGQDLFEFIKKLNPWLSRSVEDTEKKD